MPPPAHVSTPPASGDVTSYRGSKRLAKIPYTGPVFDPHGKYPPGAYVPKGFAANYRQQIVNDFSAMVDYRLGRDFPVEKRQTMAAVQNAFWDDHGPDVDLFADGKISQPEFAERTHRSTVAFADGMSKVLTDQEYMRIFDMPKDVDPFYQLYHSPEEQPGMKAKLAQAVPSNEPPRALPMAPSAQQDPAWQPPAQSGVSKGASTAQPAPVAPPASPASPAPASSAPASSSGGSSAGTTALSR
jgi:hypothetical protein